MTSRIQSTGTSSRWKTPRLAIVVGGALLLASLPILPLTFVFPPGSAPDLSHVARVRDFLFGRFGSPPPVAPGSGDHGKKPASAGTPGGQFDILQQAAQDLLIQISASPQDPALHNRLGMVYSSLGELDSAEKHFQRAVELAHLGLSNLQEKGQILQSQGKLKQACSLVLESSRLNVELSAAHSNLARVYERLGHHDRVMAELDQLNKDVVNLAAGPAGTPGRSGPVSPAVAKLLARGESLMRSGRYEEAMSAFRNVIAIDPRVALAHHQLGLAAAITNNPDIAAQELEATVKLEPANAAAHNNLGLSYQTLSELEKAQKEFEKAVALDPRMTEAAINLGNLLSAQGRYQEAAHAYSQAVMSNPRS
ncbi:MAG TPA: tetratricopeptide repeat protein, partial [Candidatus Obscuribacterales bacterium]